ncbi:MAG: ABC transporter permease subunit [Lachnospiraceae bacterium]|nr:ABC transporter permease subunit [Lachnospiraceae bacterium]
MRKLIWLEWKKNRTGRYVRNAFVLATLLALLVYGMAFLGIADDPVTGTLDMAPGMSGISAVVEFLTNSVSFVFTGVMLAAFVVSAYKNGTMALMFSYPIGRRKLFSAQLLAVWIFNFGTLVLTKLFLYGCLELGKRFHETSSFQLDFQMGSLSFYSALFLSSALVVTIGFLALFVGLFTKSSKATVIASFLVVFLIQGSLGEISLAGNYGFRLVLAFLALILMAESVVMVEKRDMLS